MKTSQYGMKWTVGLLEAESFLVWQRAAASFGRIHEGRPPTSRDSLQI